MGNVLDPDKQQQVVALGRLGWSLRRIEAATGVRRETASGYLKVAGVAGLECARQNRLFLQGCPLPSGPGSGAGSGAERR